MPGKLKRLKVPVKGLVEFSCRTGDLIQAGLAGPTADEGQKAHRKLQRNLRPEQKAEVKVGADLTLGDTCLTISGRIDLYEATNGKITLGEIKSCYAAPDKIPDSIRNLHWAQLKVYGYCVLQSDDAIADTVILQLIWFNIINDELHTEEQQFSLDELEKFTTQAAHKYIDWMNVIQSMQRDTVKSAKALVFPHAEFRAGQREMAGAIYVTARDKGTLLCEAPTGIGKTISALFPAAKALGEKHIDSIAYLTAKTSGRQSANDALALLKQHGLFITAVTITAKKTTCHCTNGTCERTDDGRCPLTIGFFDRLPQARRELITCGVITPQTIDTAATHHQLCPFELTLQLLPWVNLVICDFNYVFDPLVRLSHFSESANKKLLLVDESHNLVDRARSMYSARLNRQQMLTAAADAAGNNPFLSSAFKSVASAIQRVARQSDEFECAHEKAPATATKAVHKCIDALTSTLENQLTLTEAQADAAKELYRYAVIEDLFGDHHRAISIRNSNSKNALLKLQCLNATDKLSASFHQFKASAVFSATLRPQQYYRESLGLNSDTPCLSLPSPFNPEQQGTFLCGWIDTRYHARERAIEPLTQLAYSVYHSRPGNYQIFFPSYAFMESVHSAFTKRHPDVPTIIQQRGSSDEQRHDFLQQFDQSPLLAFSIMGGIFGEGIDYIGDKLIGTIIVGTGLASIDLQQKLIEQDFASQGLNGFDYASKYPGFTRVLQTAGRVIRSESDAGVVILADKRFNDTFYHSLFPSHWETTHCKDKESLDSALLDFWGRNFSLSCPPG